MGTKMLSFHDLYQQYAGEVYRFAFWLAGNGTEADDITSETFVRAWVRRERIRTATVKAYLFTIARNYFLEGQRKGKRMVELDETQPEKNPTPDQVVADSRGDRGTTQRGICLNAYYMTGQTANEPAQPIC
jgi:RNA polymerase sigma factor (sigma-70 family)